MDAYKKNRDKVRDHIMRLAEVSLAHGEKLSTAAFVLCDSRSCDEVHMLPSLESKAANLAAEVRNLTKWAKNEGVTLTCVALAGEAKIRTSDDAADIMSKQRVQGFSMRIESADARVEHWLTYIEGDVGGTRRIVEWRDVSGDVVLSENGDVSLFDVSALGTCAGGDA